MNKEENIKVINKNKGAITSYGIILYKFVNKIPHILMIQRKDSLCYIEFIRGKYTVSNIDYIQVLINKFNETEKKNILKYDFDELWKKMWLINTIDENKFINDYNRGKHHFNTLKMGFLHNKVYINLEYFIDNSLTNYETPEWEFPKGRKNSNETNKECAIRECGEETNYTQQDYARDFVSKIKLYLEN